MLARVAEMSDNDTSYFEDYYDYYERRVEFQVEWAIGIYVSPLLLVIGIAGQLITCPALVRLATARGRVWVGGNSASRSETTRTTVARSCPGRDLLSRTPSLAATRRSDAQEIVRGSRGQSRGQSRSQSRGQTPGQTFRVARDFTRVPREMKCTGYERVRNLAEDDEDDFDSSIGVGDNASDNAICGSGACELLGGRRNGSISNLRSGTCDRINFGVSDGLDNVKNRIDDEKEPRRVHSMERGIFSNGRNAVGGSDVNAMRRTEPIGTTRMLDSQVHGGHVELTKKKVCWNEDTLGEGGVARKLDQSSCVTGRPEYPDQRTGRKKPVLAGAACMEGWEVGRGAAGELLGAYYLATLCAVDALMVVHRLGNQCTRRLFNLDLQVSY